MANDSVLNVKDEDLVVDFRETVFSQLPNDYSEQKRVSNGRELTIKNMDPNQSGMPPAPYGEMREMLEVSYTVSDESENADFGIRVNMDPDHYCVAIEEQYISLLQDNSIRKEDLIFNVLPHIDIPELEFKDNTFERRFNPQKITNLTYYSKQDITYINSMNSEMKTAFEPLKNASKRVIRLVLGRLDKVIGEAKGIQDLRVPTTGNTDYGAIIVHGLASRINKKYDHLADLLENEGYSVYGFDYNTVGTSIKDNGKKLSDEMKRLKLKHEHILVVSHSMGGLVSRSALVYDKAGIDKLIMAGTPNKGSKIVGSPKDENGQSTMRKLTKTLLALSYGLPLFAIRHKDWYDLVVSYNHGALDQLSSKGTFIDELNEHDQIKHIKNYFSLTGDFMRIGDGLVSIEGTYSINDIKMPHIKDNWNHLNYFNSGKMEKAMKKAIEYLG